MIEETESIDPPVRDILVAAGLSTKAFYRHFRSKHELMAVLYEEAGASLRRYLERRMAEAPDPGAALASFIDGFLQQAVHPAAVKRTRPWVLGQRRLLFELPEHQSAAHARLVDLVEREILAGVEAGLFASPDPHADAELIVRSTETVLSTHLIARTPPGPATVAHLVGFVLRALRPGPPTSADGSDNGVLS